jgi:hypothetical protein
VFAFQAGNYIAELVQLALAVGGDIDDSLDCRP